MKEYTDQKFFYKAVPVDYDGVARLKRIKGNTLAFNQLVNNGNFAVSSGWATVSSASLTIGNNIATITTVNAWSGLTSSTGWSLVSGHKYLFSASYKIQTNNYEVNVYSGNLFDFSTIPCVADNQWHTIQQIIACTQSGQSTRPSFDNRTASGSYSVKNIMLIDLTQMFGAGKEPTVEQFNSLFSLPYYSYQSTLLPFKGTGIKTVGKNLLPPSTEFSSVADITISADNGVYTLNGTPSAYRQAIATNSFVLEPGTYRFSNKSNTVNNNVVIQLRSLDGLTAYAQAYTNSGETFTLTGRTEIKFRIAVNANAGTLNNYIIRPMLEFGSVATDFEPYTESITDLPISTYFPTGMKSAGTTYDELTPSKAITRLKEITFSSVSAFDSSGKLGVLGEATDAVNITNSGAVPNDRAVLETYSLEGLRTNDVNGIAQFGRSFYVRLQGKTTLSEYNTYLSANPLTVIYELATPTETDADADVFYPIYQYGTEQLLPINGATPTTAPIWCDIEYFNQIEGEIPYRKFWLVNGNGEKWNLTEKEIKSFLNNPSGLGFRKSIEITRYGERANKINEVYDFPQPQGELLFYDSVNSSRYDKYYEFTRFVMNQPITLYYQIPVSYNSMIADTYKLDCEVTELQKTESKPDRIMTTQIVFSGLGFYEGEEIEINGTGTTYTIENKGDFPVGFEITLEGSLMNPYITLSQDGEMYGEAKFDDTTAFSSVYVDSKDGEQNVVLKQSGSILPNPLSYQDLSISNGSIYVTFVKLLRGVTELTIGRRSGSLTGVKIKYSPKYRSV